MPSIFNSKKPETGRAMRDKRVDIELDQCKQYIFILQDMNDQFIKMIKKLNEKIIALEKRLDDANL